MSSSSDEWLESNDKEEESSKQQQSEQATTSDVWKTAVDPKSGKTYYYHVQTRETQWRKPKELASEEERQAMAEKEKKTREFFSAMEANILKSVSMGVRIPQKKVPTTLGDSSGSRKRNSLKARPNLVRTISTLNTKVLRELVKKVPSCRTPPNPTSALRRKNGKVASQHDDDGDGDFDDHAEPARDNTGTTVSSTASAVSPALTSPTKEVTPSVSESNDHKSLDIDHALYPLKEGDQPSNQASSCSTEDEDRSKSSDVGSGFDGGDLIQDSSMRSINIFDIDDGSDVEEQTADYNGESTMLFGESSMRFGESGGMRFSFFDKSMNNFGLSEEESSALSKLAKITEQMSRISDDSGISAGLHSSRLNVSSTTRKGRRSRRQRKYEAFEATLPDDDVIEEDLNLDEVKEQTFSFGEQPFNFGEKSFSLESGTNVFSSINEFEDEKPTNMKFEGEKSFNLNMDAEKSFNLKMDTDRTTSFNLALDGNGASSDLKFDLDESNLDLGVTTSDLQYEPSMRLDFDADKSAQNTGYDYDGSQPYEVELLDDLCDNDDHDLPAHPLKTPDAPISSPKEKRRASRRIMRRLPREDFVHDNLSAESGHSQASDLSSDWGGRKLGSRSNSKSPDPSLSSTSDRSRKLPQRSASAITARVSTPGSQCSANSRLTRSASDRALRKKKEDIVLDLGYDILPPVVPEEGGNRRRRTSQQRRNSCSTLYVGTTMSTPDKDATIKCVCAVYRVHVLQSEMILLEDHHDDMYKYRVFNDLAAYQTPVKKEDYNPSMDCDKYQAEPTLEDISNFFRDVFRRAQMESDCIIMSLIYVERLMKRTGGALRPRKCNWRSILFSCMVLSSKVWDDLSMWNADFSRTFLSGIRFPLKRINELEVAVLSALNYKVKVPASEYAKYYFLMRSCLIKSGLTGGDWEQNAPLDVEGAKRLQQVSSKFQKKGVAAMKNKNRNKKPSGYSVQRSKSSDSGGFTVDGLQHTARRGGKKKVNLEKIVQM